MKIIQLSKSTTGEARFIRQTGCPGRYGHVILRLESAPGAALSFSWEVACDDIPQEFESAVKKGVLALFEPGAKLAGRCSDGLRVRITGGSFHEVDSNEFSYTMAAAAAFLQAVASASPPSPSA